VPQKLNTATQLTPTGKVNLTHSLIGYPEGAKVSNAMAFVFGDTFICADADIAITFSAQVGGVRSATLDGDVYNPSGMLLVRVRALRAAEGRVVRAEVALWEMECVFGVPREGSRRERWGVLKQELEIK
jgi:structural maintenance of chromosome 2